MLWPTPSRLPGPVESDRTGSFGSGRARCQFDIHLLGQRNSLGAFRLLVQPSNLYMCPCASFNVAKDFSDLKKSAVMCWEPALVSFGFIQKSHLNITPHAHPAEDEIQVPLIVVITVIVAIAGQELFIFCVIMKQFAVCGNILANCT